MCKRGQPPRRFWLSLLIVACVWAGLIDDTSTTTTPVSRNSHGIVVCSGEGEMFIETIAMIEHTRFRSQSNLPIAVAHCSELSKDSVAILKSVDNVNVIDLCGAEYGQFSSLRPRLKGFFCKPAALIASPYTHTILADTDVVWFQKPELLFDSPRYVNTGTLFFRDRWTQTKNKLTLTRATHQASDVLNFVRAGALKVKHHFQDSSSVAGMTTNASRSIGAGRAGKRFEDSIRIEPPTMDNGNGRQVPPRKFPHKQSPGFAQKPHRDRDRPPKRAATNQRRRTLIETHTSSNLIREQTHSSPRGVAANLTSQIERRRRRAVHVLEPKQLAETNAFWRHLASGKGFTPDHWQDSSVVLFHSKSHPRTTFLLQHYLPDFSVGYGDKEMYWLAATAADEPFAFEPHIAGSLGDCGALVHFDPRVESSSDDNSSTGSSTDRRSFTNAKPFYINAEYLTDFRKISKSGQYLSPPYNELTKPRLMDEANTELFLLKPWKNQAHGFYPCSSCVFSTCAPADERTVIEEIKFRQKFMLALKAAKDQAPNKALSLDIYKRVRSNIAGELQRIM